MSDKKDYSSEYVVGVIAGLCSGFVVAIANIMVEKSFVLALILVFLLGVPLIVIGYFTSKHI